MQKNATTDFPTGYTARRTAASSINSKRDMFFSRETTGNNSSNSATDSSISSNTNSSSSTTTTPSSLLNNSSTKDYYYSRTRENNSYLSSIGATTTTSSTGATQMATSIAGMNNGSANGGSINSNSIGADSINLRDGLLKTNGGGSGTTTLTKDDGDTKIGFSDIPNQIHRKIVRKGFEFTLMVVGESGMGKSTLVNSLFFTNIYSDEYPGPSKRITKTVQVETTKVLLKQKSVNLQLTIVDTPGYGTAVDNSNCWQPVVEYIESRFEDYLNAETSLYRSSIEDNRVHCCLYFIYPSGHSLKPLDIEFMQHLHDKVNIVPIICKADTLTPEECAQFKKNVLAELAQHQIKYYDFSIGENDDDAKTIKQLKSRVPFAVAGSNYVHEINGQRKRCRKYPWGVVEVDNLEHCDLSALRDMLFRNYLFDLICTTNDYHYENYRCRKLSGIGSERIGKPNKDVNKNPLAQMEEEKKENEARMKKMEQEMEQVFEMKVKEKLQKLRDSEADLQRRHEQMNRNLEKDRQELDEKRQAFEREKAAFELVSKDMEEMRRVSTLEANSRENLDNKDKKKEKKKGLF